MKTTTLGRTDLDVSMFCLGGQSFGSRDDEATSYAMLDQFVEGGGNFVDTANMYAIWAGEGGESEALIGRWMKERGNRDSIVVATKIGFPAKDAPQSSKPKHILQECDRSLKRLQTDRIDLYYAHRDDRSTPLEDQLEAFDRVVTAGKVRYIGASNFKAWRLASAAAISAAHDWAAFSCVQQRYTYLRPRVDADFDFQTSCNDDLLEYCEFADLPLLAYSPLLSGAYTRPDRKIPPQYRHADSDAREVCLNEVAREIGATPNQVILAWMVGHGIIPVSGASTSEQMSESLAGFSLTLSDEILSRLDAAGAPARGE